MKKLVLLIMICCIYSSNSIAQKSKEKKSDIEIRMETVKGKCKDIQLDKRIRVTVARFTSTASNSPGELGDNMSTMLSSALSQINCFNVLEEQKNMKDMTNEIDVSNSEYTDAATGVEKGKMKIAQIIVTGEVTTYNSTTSGAKVFGIGGSQEHVKIGFILKIINPRTREILKTTNFNVESKIGGSFNVSIFSSKENSNPAIADALEKGIIQATEYMAAEKDNIPLPSEEELSFNHTVITVSNVTFSKKSNALDLIKTIPGVKKAELSSFSNSIAIYSVMHTGSTDSIATLIDKKYSAKFEITGTTSGTIAIKMK
jgi:curli biogenesis system outer membrane secretion channel CsgG